MIEYPGFDPIAIQIGPLAIRWYGLMYLLGFAGAWWLARKRAVRDDAPLKPQDVDDLIVWSALGVVIGGRVGYMLFYAADALLANPLSLFRIWEGGMSFHGGLLGVIVAMWLYGRKLGRGMFEMTDFVAPLGPIGLGTGRIGNFINGELWGRETDVPWAFVVDGRAVHPSQLYEALLEGLVLFVVLWLYSAKPRPVMSVSGLFLVGYGSFRCLVEMVRIPDAHIGYLAFDWLTMGHVLSAPMIIVGVILLVFARARSGPSAAGGSATH